MTKTALRALITVAAAGAVALTASPALADGPADPTCAAGEEFQGEFGCVAVQTDGERIGGYRCPDPSEVIISVDPDVCGPAEQFYGPAPEQEEVPSAVAPAPVDTPQAAPAPQVAPRPQAGSAAQPARTVVLDAAAARAALTQTLDQVLALIREIFTW